MMRIKLICWYLVSLFLATEPSWGNLIDFGRGSKFLCTADNDRYIVYFKPSNLEPGEYRNGQVFVLDRSRNQEWRLCDSSAICDFLLYASWSAHERCLIISDGKRVYGVDITSGKVRKSYYRADSLALFTCFALEPNGVDYCLAVRRMNSDSTKARVFKRTLLHDEQQELCSWDDQSTGEWLFPTAKWGESHDVSVLLPPPQARLLYFAGGSEFLVDTAVISLHLLYRGGLFYSKDNGTESILFRGNCATGSRLDIMSGDKIEFSYVGPYGIDDCVAIGVGQEVLLYCSKQREVHKLSPFPKGKCVYLGVGFAVVVQDEHLRLMEL
jgi:hypothetical protein